MCTHRFDFFDFDFFDLDDLDFDFDLDRDLRFRFGDLEVELLWREGETERDFFLLDDDEALGDVDLVWRYWLQLKVDCN